jgi:hypothetical protein
MKKMKNGNMTGWLRCLMVCLLTTIILASLVASNGCAKKTATTTQEIPANYTTYKDEAGLFSISYPPDWEAALSVIPDAEAAIKDVINAVNSDVPIENAHVIFFAGIRRENNYAPNVNIGVEAIPGIVLTHNSLVEAEVTGIKGIIPDYHEFSRVKTTVDGRDATIINWEGTYPQLGKVRCLQMFILVGKTGWAVTCSPPSGEYSKWDQDFQVIMRSLRILK